MTRSYVAALLSLVALALASSITHAADFVTRYFGGTANDRAQYVNVDSEGNVIFAGTTSSKDLPVTPGSIVQTIPTGMTSDIYIAKYSRDLKTLLKATYLGVPSSDNAINLQSVKVNEATGEIGLLVQWGGGSQGGKIIKLSKDLQIVASSLPIQISNGWVVVFDIDFKPSSGEIYAVGNLGSDTDKFQHFNSFSGTETILTTLDEPCVSPGSCAFIIKLTKDLKVITAATVLQTKTSAAAVKYIAGSDSVILGGTTETKTLTNPNNSYLGGATDGIVASFSGGSLTPIATNFIGGEDVDYVFSIKEDARTKNIFIVGVSYSNSISGQNPTIQSPFSRKDHFIARLPSSIAYVEYSNFTRTPVVDDPYLMFKMPWDTYKINSASIDVNSATGELVFLSYTNLPDESLISNYFGIEGVNAAARIEIERFSSDLKTLRKNILISGSETTGEGSVSVSPDGTQMFAVATTYAKDFVSATNAAASSDTTESDAVIMKLTGDLVLDDNDPNHFSFVAQKDLLPNHYAFSNMITVSGLDGVAAVGVSGDGAYWKAPAGEPISTCDRDFSHYTKNASSVKSGDKICVAHKTESAFQATNSTTLKVGNYSAIFNTSNAVKDDQPDELTTRYEITGVPGSEVIWGAYPIMGINTSVKVSVSNGEYKLGCKNNLEDSGFASTASANVTEGTTLCIRQITPSSSGATTEATVTIGAKTFIFKSTALDTSRNSDGAGGGGGGGAQEFLGLGLISLMILRKLKPNSV